MPSKSAFRNPQSAISSSFAMFPTDQYNALRTGCGMVVLADWSSVTLAGADRQNFLNNFSTNDVKRLTPGSSCEAFLTNVKGKVLGHALVTCRDDALVLITVPGQAPALIEHLDRYLIREDVQFRDTTAERCHLLVAGGEAADDALRHVARSNPLRMDWSLLQATSCALLEAAPHAMPQIQQALRAHGGVLCGDEAFTARRIESGAPLFGIDFDSTNFPQEVGRDRQAISFTKGCYLGQETVARIDALGHVNQQLVGVRFPEGEVPAHGTELLHDGKPAGRVGSAAFSPQLGAPLALAMLRREFTAPGSQVESPLGPCEVVALPLPG
jgi:tRNA-modifying protein YgfZ